MRLGSERVNAARAARGSPSRARLPPGPVGRGPRALATRGLAGSAARSRWRRGPSRSRSESDRWGRPVAILKGALQGELRLVRGPERIASGWWDGERRRPLLLRGRDQDRLAPLALPRRKNRGVLRARRVLVRGESSTDGFCETSRATRDECRADSRAMGKRASLAPLARSACDSFTTSVDLGWAPAPRGESKRTNARNLEWTRARTTP